MSESLQVINIDQDDLDNILTDSIEMYKTALECLTNDNKAFCGIECFLEDILYVKLIKDKAASHIAKYLRSFHVDTANGINEIKSIYWIGMALSEVVENKHIYYSQILMLNVLTDLIKHRLDISHEFKKTSKDSQKHFHARLKMFLKKFKDIILQNRLEEDLGRYGIYMLFSMLDMVYVDTVSK